MFRYIVVFMSILILVTTPAYASRIALVIGNSNYDEKFNKLHLEKLRNPVNDAIDMASVLRSLGYEVILKTDVRKKAMKRAVRDFAGRLRQRGTVGVFFFSGHGFQHKNINYLMPLRADIHSDVDIEDEALKADYVLRHMEKSNRGMNVMILDACRNNIPDDFFRKSKGAFAGLSKGLGNMSAPIGTLIAYATAPNKISWGGLPGERNSAYTKHLLAVLRQQAHLRVEDLFIAVRKRVMQETKGEPEPQVPWESGSLTQRFCFGQCGPGMPSVPYVAALLRVCETHFRAHRLTTGRGGTALACYEEVLQKDKGNAEALAGLEKIAAKYVKWAKQALDRGQKDRARRYLAGLRKVNPESPMLATLEAELHSSNNTMTQPLVNLPTQNVAEITTYNIGNDIEFPTTPSSSMSSNYLLGSRITLTQSATLKKFGLIAKKRGSEVKFALYTDKNGSPHTLIISSKGTKLERGKMEIPVENAYLSAENYWIMAVYNSNAQVGKKLGVSDTVKYIAHSFTDPLPKIFPEPTSYTGQRFNYYIVVH
jgi:hypothetical protein